MRAFQRRDEVLEAEMESFEVALLASLTEQLVTLLADPEDAAACDDPFERWAGEFGTARTLDRNDSVVQRLFPDAVPGDPVATEEFRRLTEDAQRRQRIADAHLVLDDLEETDDDEAVLRVPPEHLTAWLKTVNSLRLSLSARLGVTDEDSLERLSRLSPRDPRSQIVDIFDWLGFVLESLLEA